jgi:hypothetical protein
MRYILSKLWPFLLLGLVVVAMAGPTKNSQDGPESDKGGCQNQTPVLVYEVELSEGTGRSIPVKLPRNSTDSGKTELDFYVSWGNPRLSTKIKPLLNWAEKPLETEVPPGNREVALDFYYDAVFSVEYPIYRISVQEVSKDQGYTGHFDFSDDCQSPMGRSIHARQQVRAAIFALPKATSQLLQRLRITIWGGLY